ncbi:MAG: hypothetical protein U0X41_03620 [Chitinophagales bacterium]
MCLLIVNNKPVKSVSNGKEFKLSTGTKLYGILYTAVSIGCSVMKLPFTGKCLE